MKSTLWLFEGMQSTAWSFWFYFDLFGVVVIGREVAVILRLGQNLLYVNQYHIWYPPLFELPVMPPTFLTLLDPTVIVPEFNS